MRLEEVKINDGKKGYELPEYELFFTDENIRTSIIKYEKGELSANWEDFSEDISASVDFSLKSENNLIQVIVSFSSYGYTSGGSPLEAHQSRIVFQSDDNGVTFVQIEK